MEEFDKAKVRTINWGRLRLVEILSIPLSSEIRMLLSSCCRKNSFDTGVLYPTFPGEIGEVRVSLLHPLFSKCL